MRCIAEWTFVSIDCPLYVRIKQQHAVQQIPHTSRAQAGSGARLGFKRLPPLRPLSPLSTAYAAGMNSAEHNISWEL